MSTISEQSVWHNINLDEDFKVGIIYIENTNTVIGGTYLDAGYYEEYCVNDFFSQFEFISEGKI